MGRENAKAYTEHTKNKCRNEDLKKELELDPIVEVMRDREKKQSSQKVVDRK